MRGIRVGSQLFINRHDTAERVAGLMRKMKEAGFSLVRVFLVWDHLEPREGQWEWEVYDRLFVEAELNGIQVVATLMAVSPPGWMQLTDGLQDVANLDDPAIWQHVLRYVREVVSRWRSSPALHSWILWNEPARVLGREDSTMDAYREFLRESYGEISKLNHLYHRQYGTFDEVGREERMGGYALGFGSRIEQIDWLEFTVSNLMERLERLAGEVRSRDLVHPLHVNPHRISQCLFDSGQSIWQEAKIADFLGFSAHPAWHSLRFPEDRIQQSVAMFADLTRSANRHPKGTFWCTELQGGPTLYTAFRPSSPTGPEIARWMWESAASGAEAVVFWCFNCRDDGYEAGEWSLLNADQSPSIRLQQASRVARAFQESAEWLDGAVPEPEVFILCSEATQLLGLVEGEGEDVTNPRNRQMAADALCGAYLMASDLGYEVGFLDEERLQAEGVPASGKLLLVPGCIVLSLESLAVLQRWVTAGGILIADSLIGWKDRAGSLDRSTWQAVDSLFGAGASDYSVIGDMPFADNWDALTKGWFFRVLFECRPEAQVLAYWPDEWPAIVEKSHGAGRAVRLGTVFFQRYLAFPEEAHRRLLIRLGGMVVPGPLRLLNGTPHLRLRRLASARGTVGVLINTGGAATAELYFEEDGQWQILGRAARRVTAGKSYEIAVGPDEVVCFQLSPAASLSQPRPGTFRVTAG